MTFTRAIVRPPSATFAEGLTTAGLGPPDLPAALAQHAAYLAALEACGLEVTTLPPDDRFPDSTFVEDTAVLARGLAVLCRPGAPSRAGEVDAIRPALEAFFHSSAAIEAPGTVDGGDVCEAGDHVFIGVSERTNEGGARQLASLLSPLGLGSSVVDIRGIPGLLHLKSGIAWLGGRTLALTDLLASRPEFRGWSRLPVPPGEEYAANAVLVNGRVLLAAGFPRFEGAVRALGLPTVPLDMSEFRKLDGGLSCLSLRF
ncbi:MAG: N(G),N(G)-dimethylarginine dimethylaminohydrolase [Holophagales bacterium]|nr:N(G),N(G)-dimethylarginine dimethylaminohydrolase [Holophagales bacterium]